MRSTGFFKIIYRLWPFIPQQLLPERDCAFRLIGAWGFFEMSLVLY